MNFSSFLFILLFSLLTSSCRKVFQAHPDNEILSCGEEIQREQEYDKLFISINDGQGKRVSPQNLQIFWNEKRLPIPSFSRVGCLKLPAEPGELVANIKNQKVSGRIHFGHPIQKNAEQKRIEILTVRPHQQSFEVWRLCGDWKKIPDPEKFDFFKMDFTEVGQPEGGPPGQGEDFLAYLVETGERRERPLPLSDQHCLAVEKGKKGLLFASHRLKNWGGVLEYFRGNGPENKIPPLTMKKVKDLPTFFKCGTEVPDHHHLYKIFWKDLEEVWAHHKPFIEFSPSPTDPVPSLTPRGCLLIPSLFLERDPLVAYSIWLTEASSRHESPQDRPVWFATGQIHLPEPESFIQLKLAATDPLTMRCPVGQEPGRYTREQFSPFQEPPQDNRWKLYNITTQILNAPAGWSGDGNLTFPVPLDLSSPQFPDGEYTLRVKEQYRVEPDGPPSLELTCPILKDTQKPRLRPENGVDLDKVNVVLPHSALTLTDPLDNKSSPWNVYLCTKEGTSCQCRPEEYEEIKVGEGRHHVTIKLPDQGIWSYCLFSKDYAGNRSDDIQISFRIHHQTEINYIASLSREAELLHASGRPFEALLVALNAEIHRQDLSLEEEKREAHDHVLRAFLGIIGENQEINSLFGHKGPVNEVRFAGNSHSGRFLWTVGDDRTIRRWNLAGEEENSPLALVHEGRVLGLEVSPSGNMLASIDDLGVVGLWKEEGELYRKMKIPLDPTVFPPDNILTPIFHPLKEQIAFSIGRQIYLWDYVRETGPRPLHPPDSGHQDQITSLDYHPEGNFLASTGRDSAVKIWDLEGPFAIPSLNFENHSSFSTLEDRQKYKRVNKVRFFPGHTGHGGGRFATASDDGVTRFCDMGTRECLPKVWDEKVRVEHHSGRNYVLDINPKGTEVATGSDDNSVKVWNAKGELITTLPGFNRAVRSIKYSPDGKLLAAASDDHTIRIWKTDSYQVKEILRGHTGWVRSIDFDESSKFLVSSGPDERPRIWNVKESIHQKIIGPQFSINDFRFFPGKKDLLAVGNYQDTLNNPNMTRWDLLTHSSLPVPPMGMERDNLTAMDISPQGLVALGTEEGEIFVKDMRGQDPPLLVGQHGRADNPDKKYKEVRALLFHPQNENWLLSGGKDNLVRVWKRKDGSWEKAVEFTQLKHQDYVNAIDISPDGRVLAVASDDYTIKLWDLAQDPISSIRVLKGHRDYVKTVQFFPSKDKPTLLTGGADNQVLLWDYQKGQILHHYLGATDWIKSARFSEDGRYVIAGGRDGEIRIWKYGEDSPWATIPGHQFEKGWFMAITRVELLLDSRQGPEKIVSAGQDGTLQIWELDLSKMVKRVCRWASPFLNQKINRELPASQFCKKMEENLPGVRL